MQHPATSNRPIHPSLLNPPPPLMLTVACSGTSPASTMSVLTTIRTKTHQSLRQALAMKHISESVASTTHYGTSVTENLEIPDVNGGDIMPPLSPCVNAEFTRVSVGIPTLKSSRTITKNYENHEN